MSAEVIPSPKFQIEDANAAVFTNVELINCVELFTHPVENAKSTAGNPCTIKGLTMVSMHPPELVTISVT